MALATVEVVAGTVVGMDETLNVPLSDVTVRGHAAFRLSMSAIGVKDKIIDSKENSHMGPGRGGGRQAEHNVVHDGLIFDGIEAVKDNTCRSSTPGHGGGRQAEHDVIHDGLIFDGIEAAKDNTHRSSYACMLVPIEDGAELEAEWEGCSRLRSTWKRGLDERSHLDDADDHVPVVIWVQMSVEDVVVADKQNTMSSKMDLRWYRGRGRQHM
ncbi:hypothetical protein EDB86DRAFT_2833554 [Lactarius hatsudake]|nr:hypothetical protein EDB86DRAFT_2833554 [Lactarius hatsudake]